MAEASQPVCMTCGQSAGTPLRFNHLPSGEPCPACAERLLEAMASLLPGARAAVDAKKGGRGSGKSALRALPRIAGGAVPRDRAEPEPA
ncbi:MAG: hypothetical protein EPO68_14320 [Planctomycetota bacterium]|nr:MAG: hypothetical protein EPO68_14320 [Planctomycetota bacterium]